MLRAETFEADLNRRCSWGARSDEYRVRWSPVRETFEIEQRVGRPVYGGNVSPRLRQKFPDEWARMKDGYHLVARVAPEARFRCSQCRAWLPAPEGRFGEVDCPLCREHPTRNRSQTFVGYWPLSEGLLTHLEWSHPRRASAFKQELAEKNAAAAAASERDRINFMESAALEVRHHIAGTPRTSNLTNSAD